jgi:hypothetical protein
MYELESSRTEQISTRRAEEMLRRNTFDGQRPVNKNWVQHLANAQKTGTFTKGHIAFGVNGNNTDVLMNGQHQLHASILSGTTITATIDRYRCHDKDDMWHLFATFDTQRPRSERHVMKAARGFFSRELQGVPLDILAACGTALLWLGGGTVANFNAKAASKAMKADLCQQYEKDVLEVARYARDGERIHVPVAGAIIATSRKNIQKARPFWERVIGGDQLVRNTPQWHLNKSLGSTGDRFTSGMGRNTGIYSLCVAWWNAYLAGTPRVSVKLASMKTIPEVKG